MQQLPMIGECISNVLQRTVKIRGGPNFNILEALRRRWWHV